MTVNEYLSVSMSVSKVIYMARTEQGDAGDLFYVNMKQVLGTYSTCTQKLLQVKISDAFG